MTRFEKRASASSASRSSFVSFTKWPIERDGPRSGRLPLAGELVLLRFFLVFYSEDKSSGDPRRQLEPREIDAAAMSPLAADKLIDEGDNRRLPWPRYSSRWRGQASRHAIRYLRKCSTRSRGAGRFN